jgi:hypothetical protein
MDKLPGEPTAWPGGSRGPAPTRSPPCSFHRRQFPAAADGYGASNEDDASVHAVWTAGNSRIIPGIPRIRGPELGVAGFGGCPARGYPDWTNATPRGLYLGIARRNARSTTASARPGYGGCAHLPDSVSGRRERQTPAAGRGAPGRGRQPRRERSPGVSGTAERNGDVPWAKGTRRPATAGEGSALVSTRDTVVSTHTRPPPAGPPARP